MKLGSESVFFSRPATIGIVSPQRWDDLKVSKHHYASELARLGHRVLFIEPPNLVGPPGVTLSETDTPGVTRVAYTPWFPYRLKFHARWLFDAAMRRQARLLASKLGGRLDVIWDFDNSYQFADLRWFGARVRVFHPVDDLPARALGDKKAHALFSVSQSFLDRIGACGTVVPHGLSELYLSAAREVVADPGSSVSEGEPAFGYVGNLDHIGIDWPTLLRIGRENLGVRIDLIGPYSPNRIPEAELAKAGNFRLLGRMTPREVLAHARTLSGWLVCYDAGKTRDGATNSHKILEYLATGHPVLSNRISAYEGSELVRMPADFNNESMPSLLAQMIADFRQLNAPEARRARAAFALEFSYEANLRKIDAILASTLATDLAVAA